MNLPSKKVGLLLIKVGLILWGSFKSAVHKLEICREQGSKSTLNQLTGLQQEAVSQSHKTVSKTIIPM